jgi:hypothetical protein
LHVVPFPGTPDASPSSAVIFSALRPWELRSVTVTGSQSGGHRGRLEALPANAGTEFVPDLPFTAGETVRVSAHLSSVGAGAAEGDPGSSHLSYSFTVAVPVASLGLDPGRSPRKDLEAQSWMSTTGYGPTQSFHSEPDLHPPVVTVTSNPDRSSGDIFLNPERSPQIGPMILNSSGQVIWFHPVSNPSPYDLTGNLAVQRYHGKPVLTWWQGLVVGGVITRPSYDVIMNRAYRTVAIIRGGDGYIPDVHDFQITPQGTAYLDAAVVTQANLSNVGGPTKGKVMDYVIQEVDIKTGKVLWEWHALGHVPLHASYLPYSRQEAWYDYFHLNSIQQLPDGNLLISGRDTWSVYEISRKTGKVIWTLGGKRSDFRMGRGTKFEWQHDARLRGHTLSLLDDAADPQEESQSSAKYLRVDTATHTVSLVRSFTHYPPVLASAGGSMQTLPNGNVFVGWGSVPQFSEFTAAGRQIFNGTFALRLSSYRAVRFPWVGKPLTRPSLAVSPGPAGHLTAYASWNGATAVAGWRMVGGPTPQHLLPLGVTVRPSGFETTIDVPSEPRYVAVQALDRKGSVLSTSRPRTDPPHLALFGSSAFVSTSEGVASVPVGCIAGRDCRVTVTIRSRGSVRGRSHPQVVLARRAALVSVSLSASGQHELHNAPHHRLPVQVIVRSSSGLPVVRADLTLIPYGATGASRPGSISTAPGAEIVDRLGFVSSNGLTSILTACYASVPCRLVETVTAGGQVIARTAKRVLLGTNELVYVEIPLDQAGRMLLARAGGRDIPAQVNVRSDGRVRTEQIDLVRYG